MRPLAWCLLLGVVAWVYWPGLDGPPILDDASNLRVLSKIDEDPSYARDVVLGNNSGPSGRPLSMLTFAVETLYFDGGIRLSKAINLGLHLCSGTLLMFLLHALLVGRRVKGGTALVISLASIWLLSPLFVSTVLYPIQRMAQLACLFTLASLLCYAHWRLRLMAGKRAWPLLALLPLLLAAAALSKENGLLGAPLVVLLELLWFQFKTADGVAPLRLRQGVFGLIAVGAVLSLLYLWLNSALLTGPYATREFTMWERLLTQGRILWDYQAQFFWPEVARLGVYHDDYRFSRSLADPRTTLWAWLAWGAVLLGTAAAACYARSRRYACAVLLFFLGHSVESSVLGLELYFEHRNYFPVLGVLLLIGLLAQDIGRALPELRTLMVVLLSLLAGLLGLQTASQAQIWSNDDLIRMTVFNGHPQSPRANVNLAVLLARAGAIDEALKMSARAGELRSERIGDRSARDLLLSCYANRPLPPDHLAQLPIWTAKGRVISQTNTLHFLVLKLQNGECPAIDVQDIADRFATLLLAPERRATVTAQVYAGLVVLENALGGTERALAYAEYYLEIEPENPQALLMRLHFANILGNDAVVSDSLGRLSWLREQGRLTREQQDTLDLYVDS
ncbi:MAG: hypothetical protein AAGI11_20495 [Pseudomonadota bacterium]